MMEHKTDKKQEKKKKHHSLPAARRVQDK